MSADHFLHVSHRARIHRAFSHPLGDQWRGLVWLPYLQVPARLWLSAWIIQEKYSPCSEETRERLSRQFISFRHPGTWDAFQGLQLYCRSSDLGLPYHVLGGHSLAFRVGQLRPEPLLVEINPALCQGFLGDKALWDEVSSETSS